MASDHYAPLVVGHRGLLQRGIRRNSILAMEIAIDEGADAVECDLRLSSDRHLFLTHERCTEETKRLISTMSASELCDDGFDDFDALLGLAACYPHCRFEIEPKGVAPYEVMLETLPQDEQFIIISFSDLVCHSAIAAGYTTVQLDWDAANALDLAPEGAMFGPHWSTISSLNEQELRRAGVWTVNDLRVAEQLIESRVWAITTDYPGVLRKFVDERCGK